MRVIVAGSRDIQLSPEQVSTLVKNSGFEITELVSGVCRGVDQSAEAWATLKKIPIKQFPYKSELGKAGGPVRNREMADYADALIAVVALDSKGTYDMVAQMAARKKPLYVRTVLR